MDFPKIDEEQNRLLRERFNPEGSLLRRQQHRMTEILVEFDKICRKHDIPYWICSGTLLGCIRHGGYIPWDDDLDVEIMRPDYERLMKVLPDELPEYLALQNRDTDPNFFFCYAKLRDKRSHLEEVNHYDRVFKYRGIYMDIFPYEKITPSLQRLSWDTIGPMYKPMNNPSLTDEQALKRVNFIYNLNQRIIFPVMRFLSRFSGQKLVRYSPGIPYNNTTYYDEVFPVQYAKFEGVDVPIPHDWHSYLSRKFGDYMQLPDLDALHLHVGNLTIDE